MGGQTPDSMTPIPDNIAEAVDALMRASYDDDGLELKPLKESRARLDALIGEVVAERDRYQELRKLIDGGSESMTHVDALSTIGQLQEALEERDRLKQSLDKQSAAFKMGLDAAKETASHQLEAARKLHAESNPDALDSERAMNATLTEENDRLRGQLATAQDLFDGLYTENVNLRSTIAAQEQPRCPDALLPDGPVCPKCGGRRGPSGVDGGSWVHY